MRNDLKIRRGKKAHIHCLANWENWGSRGSGITPIRAVPSPRFNTGRFPAVLSGHRLGTSHAASSSDREPQGRRRSAVSALGGPRPLGSVRERPVAAPCLSVPRGRSSFAVFECFRTAVSLPGGPPPWWHFASAVCHVAVPSEGPPLPEVTASLLGRPSSR